MKRFMIFLMVFAFALSVYCVNAQDNYDNTSHQSGTISGIVVCPNPKDESKLDPVAQARISVEDSSYSTLTDKEGKFELTNIAYGTYKLTAQKNNYYQDEKIVTLSNAFANITMTITPTEEKTVKTQPGKNIKQGKTPKHEVFVAFAAPASSKTQAVAPQLGSMEDLSSFDPNIMAAAIAQGADPLSFGVGERPKIPKPYDPLTPQTMYENSIMLFDVKTPSKTTYVNLSAQPYWMVYNPETKLLYLSSQSQMVLMYDPGTNKMIGAFAVKGQVTDMCLNKDGSILYIAVMGRTPAILVLDCYKNKFMTPYVVPSRPASLAASPDGKNLYFSMGTNTSGMVYSISTLTDSTAGKVSVGKNPNGMCITPDGKELYVTNLNSASVSVIDAATLTVKDTIPVGIEPLKIVVAPNGKKVYLTCRKSDYVTVIDTGTHTVLKNINTGKAPTGIAISGDGSKVYVTNNESKTISIIDTESDTVSQTTVAQPRSHPWGIAVK
ncbi:MAG: beta-propeller fold lactonase family protein [Armatimonadota bacterium]